MTQNKMVLLGTGRHKEGENKLAKPKRKSYVKEVETADFPFMNPYNTAV
jgi:hypothetical protein